MQAKQSRQIGICSGDLPVGGRKLLRTYSECALNHFQSQRSGVAPAPPGAASIRRRPGGGSSRPLAVWQHKLIGGSARRFGISRGLMVRRSVRMGCRPKFVSHAQGLDAISRPPAHFIVGAMQLAMVHAAERHGEFVADLQAKASRLGKAQMMGIGRLTTANETGLGRDKSAMAFVTPSPGARRHRICLKFKGGRRGEGRGPRWSGGLNSAGWRWRGISLWRVGSGRPGSATARQSHRRLAPAWPPRRLLPRGRPLPSTCFC